MDSDEEIDTATNPPGFTITVEIGMTATFEIDVRDSHTDTFDDAARNGLIRLEAYLDGFPDAKNVRLEAADGRRVLQVVGTWKPKPEAGGL